MPLPDVLPSNVCSAVPWRLELFFKSTSELQSKVIPFIKQHGLRRINITNKVLKTWQNLQMICMYHLFSADVLC